MFVCGEGNLWFVCFTLSLSFSLMFFFLFKTKKKININHKRSAKNLYVDSLIRISLFSRLLLLLLLLSVSLLPALISLTAFDDFEAALLLPLPLPPPPLLLFPPFV